MSNSQCRVVDYKMVHIGGCPPYENTDADELLTFLNKGWVLYGSPVVACDLGLTNFYQAIIRREVKEKGE